MDCESITLAIRVPFFDIGLDVFFKNGRKVWLFNILIKNELYQMVMMETKRQSKKCLEMHWCLKQLN